MDFRTTITPERHVHHAISYASDIVLLGSCFTENISEKLEYFQFPHLVNPFGILYNPVAIENFISRVLNSEAYSEKDIFEQEGIWRCLDAHSRLSSTDPADLTDQLNTALDISRNRLKTASHLIISYGTSWVYRKIDEDRIVANCHKIPQKKFLKELLSVEEVNLSIQGTIALLKEFNSELSVIFTVSPVRHLRDGLIENSNSKAHLKAALLEILNPGKQIFYFPSFEIMIDDLRDYRFYKTDLLHPNETAIEYIWNAFRNSWISEDCYDVMNEVEDLRRAYAHKPFQPRSDSYKAFLEKTDEQAIKLSARFPHMKFD